jgi:hypothetical protein
MADRLPLPRDRARRGGGPAAGQRIRARRPRLRLVAATGWKNSLAPVVRA